MSSRLPTRWLSRSVPSSMVSSSSRVAAGVKSTSRCSRLLTAALIDESGVRRSCDTAASSAVRSSFAASRSPARAASARKVALLQRHRDLPGERLEHGEVFGSEAVAADDQDVAARQRHREVGGLRPRGHGRAHTGDDGPARNRSTRDSTPTDSAPNAACTCATSCGSGSAAAPSVPLSDASVSASARARAASTVRRDAVDTSAADDRADEQEDPEREQVLPLRHRELVERRREEPVGEQEAGHRARRTPGRNHRGRRPPRRAGAARADRSAGSACRAAAPGRG